MSKAIYSYPLECNMISWPYPCLQDIKLLFTSFITMGCARVEPSKWSWMFHSKTCEGWSWYREPHTCQKEHYKTEGYHAPYDIVTGGQGSSDLKVSLGHCL